MTPAFGDFRILIDPWEVDYGDQTPLESTEDRPDDEVDHEVEVADDEWAPIAPLKRFSKRPCTTWGGRGTSARTDAGGPMRAY